jgi:hypothetical protein
VSRRFWNIIAEEPEAFILEARLRGSDPPRIVALHETAPEDAARVLGAGAWTIRATRRDGGDVRGPGARGRLRPAMLATLIGAEAPKGDAAASVDDAVRVARSQAEQEEARARAMRARAEASRYERDLGNGANSENGIALAMRELAAGLRRLEERAFAAPKSDPLVAILTAIAPLALELIRDSRAAQERTTQMIMAMIRGNDSEGGGPSTLSEVTTALAALDQLRGGGASPVQAAKEIIQLAREASALSGGGGEGGEGSALAQIVVGLINARNSAPAPAPTSAVSSQRVPQDTGAGATPHPNGAAVPAAFQQTPPPTVPGGPAMAHRVANVAQVIIRELEARTDPYQVAATMGDALRLLPEEVRDAMLDENMASALPRLARFLPVSLSGKLASLASKDERGKKWLQTFLEAVREELTEPAEGDGDDAADDDLDDSGE